jgi:hypothetical protein
VPLIANLHILYTSWLAWLRDADGNCNEEPAETLEVNKHKQKVDRTGLAVQVAV